MFPLISLFRYAWVSLSFQQTIYRRKRNLQLKPKWTKRGIPQIKTEYAKKNMKEISHPSEGYINKKNVSDQIMV